MIRSGAKFLILSRLCGELGSCGWNSSIPCLRANSATGQGWRCKWRPAALSGWLRTNSASSRCIKRCREGIPKEELPAKIKRIVGLFLAADVDSVHGFAFQFLDLAAQLEAGDRA